MEAPRAPYREFTDPSNRNMLATLNPRTWACAHRSLARAEELEIPEKAERILDAIMMTASFNGKGREDFRDALMGQRAPTVAVGVQQPVKDGVRTL